MKRYRYLSYRGEILTADAADFTPGDPATGQWQSIGRHAQRAGRRFLAAVLVLVSGCTFWPGSAAPEGPIPDASSSSDGGAGGDSSTTPDVAQPGDAPPAIVTLSETASTNITPGSSVVCYASGGTSTVDGAWFRVFSHVDHVTAVGFATDKAYRATTVTVKIGTYSGSMGGATLASSQIAILATQAATVPDGDTPQGVTVQLAQPVAIPASALVLIEVSSGDLTGWGYFFLGATTSAQTEPGYFQSIHGCGAWPAGNPPAQTPSGSGHLVIEAQGY